MYRRLVKRGMDLVVLAFAAPVALAIVLVVSALVRWRMGAPVLFRQARVGYREQSFELVKFRTMSNARDERGFLLPEDQRITRLGRFLRSTSMDEVPTLWNVLR